MKIPSFLTALFLAAQPLLAAEPAKTAEPRSPRILLQEALFAEEAERDLEKASAGYAEMLAQFETQRTLAATALYHLAEIRAKQKKTAEAIALHQRLIAEFAKEEALAKLSRARLTELGAAAPAPAVAGAGTISAEEAKELARVQKIVQDSPDLLNAVDENEHAPIVRACLAGWIQVTTFLLDHGVNIDGKDGAWVPLHGAARGGHKRLVELLLERGADVNATARGGGWTALHSASNHNRVEVARVLLEHGAKPNVVAHDARRFDAPEATPLLLAIEKQEKEMVALLLEKGADASLANPDTHKTPLVSALWENQKDVFKLLLDHQAQVDQPAAAGVTPLIFSAKSYRDEAMKALLARKARVDLADETGATALHYAAATAEPLVQVLLAAGASPKAVTKEGLTPLHFSLQERFKNGPPSPYGSGPTALQQKHFASLPQIWEALVAKGGDLNAADQRGFTLLHYACGTPDVPVEQIVQLTQRGADPELKSKEGILPLLFAQAPRRNELERFIVYPKLVKQRAINVLDRSNETFAPPMVMEAASLDAEPPTMEELQKKFSFGKSLSLPVRLTIYRADAGGEIKEAGSRDEPAAIGAPPPPKLQWGDIVVIGNVNSGNMEADQLRRMRTILRQKSQNP